MNKSLSVIFVPLVVFKPVHRVILKVGQYSELSDEYCELSFKPILVVDDVSVYYRVLSFQWFVASRNLLNDCMTRAHDSVVLNW